MYPQVLYVGVFLLIIACLPWLTKWLVRRNVLGPKSIAGASKLVSAVAVGPSQRVVTVEVGPENDRTWLVLGVTAHQVTFLHRCAIVADAVGNPLDSAHKNMTPAEASFQHE